MPASANQEAVPRVIPYAELSVPVLILLLIGGLVVLSAGGDFLARGAASLALVLELNPVVVGLTVVAIATSLPELVTALIAAGDGEDDLAIGNIVGSNLANVGLILGVSALVFPLTIQQRLIRKEVPILLALSGLFFALSFGGLSRIEGGVLFLCMLGYLYFVTREAKTLPADEAEVSPDLANPIKSVPKCILLVVLGGVFLWLGAELLINSAAVLAEKAGIPKVIVGLTIVAIGTSLPELAASVAAALRKQSDIIAGNIVGSNIFNIVLIGGGVGTVYSLDVNERLFYLEFPAMIVFSGLLWFIFITQKRVVRAEGAILLLLYVVTLLASTWLQWAT
ncbi:MAG: calcium/sodium antiporter [Opitutales bacterium]